MIEYKTRKLRINTDQNSIELMKLLLTFLLSTLPSSQPKISVIAHAGGGIQGSTYTNSFEAMNLNYSKGFELFELDFSWTSDQQLVCLHDWGKTPRWLLNYHDMKPLTLKEFQLLDQKRTDITLCDLESLNLWLKKHPKAYVVTDIKEHNIDGLILMAESIENAERRIIPQITQPEQYLPVKAMGFDSIIWTLYQFNGTNQQVIESVRNMDLFAITMPIHRAKQMLAKQLKQLNIATYVHTINSQEEAQELKNTYGLTSIITDFLPAD